MKHRFKEIDESLGMLVDFPRDYSDIKLCRQFMTKPSHLKRFIMNSREDMKFLLFHSKRLHGIMRDLMGLSDIEGSEEYRRSVERILSRYREEFHE